MKTILKGAYDLHFHTAPDVVERKCTDIGLAERWQDAGMQGGVIKSHFSDTSGRAAILREIYPGLQIYGGLVLNRQAGGINPHATEKMAQASGKFLWLPTLDAYSYQSFRLGAEPEDKGYLKILNGEAQLLSVVEEVLEVVLQYDLVLCTGHVSAEEGMKVLTAAAKKGIRRMIVTHADNPANRYTIEQQKECVRLGAKIEHCYFTTLYERSSWEQIVEEIRAVGAEQVLLTTDFGQISSPHSDEGMEEYVTGLMQRGIMEAEIEKMIVKNPSQLLA